MKKLNEIGKAENTIIVFAGDNGLGMGQHSLMGKQNLYEHSIKVPLVFAGKGLPSGKTVDSLCYLHDIYPTICDIVGTKIPATVKGKSLSKMFKDPGYQVRQGIYTSYRDFQRSIVEKRYKLIEYNVKGKRTTQLFDLKNDPWEMNNLAKSDDHRDVLAALRRKCAAHSQSLNEQRRVFRGTVQVQKR
jgi:arylsulfatase A-like enzyme